MMNIMLGGYVLSGYFRDMIMDGQTDRDYDAVLRDAASQIAWDPKMSPMFMAVSYRLSLVCSAACVATSGLGGRYGLWVAAAYYAPGLVEAVWLRAYFRRRALWTAYAGTAAAVAHAALFVGLAWHGGARCAAALYLPGVAAAALPLWLILRTRPGCAK